MFLYISIIKTNILLYIWNINNKLNYYCNIEIKFLLLIKVYIKKKNKLFNMICDQDLLH